MRTFLTIAIVFTFLTTATLFGSIFARNHAYALCSEVKDPNVSCHEQYNTRSNIDSTTSSTVEEDDDKTPMLCSDLKCSLGHEYMLDPDNDLAEDSLDFMDY